MLVEPAFIAPHTKRIGMQRPSSSQEAWHWRSEVSGSDPAPLRARIKEASGSLVASGIVPFGKECRGSARISRARTDFCPLDVL
eukprot:scaffold7657_cov109-Isochrysis_galbana.AAC.6